MPNYSLFRYGTRKYAEVTAVLVRSTIFAQLLDYGVVYLSASMPSRTGLSYAIVRTKTGAAEDPSAGVVVSTGEVTSASVVVYDGIDNLEDDATDNDVPLSSGMAYYTLFVFDEYGSWTKDAATSVVVPRDRKTLEFFRYAIPGFYISEEHQPTDPFDENSALLQFLYGFALTYDELAQHVDMILPENRGNNSIRRLHPSYARGIGMPSEYTIGVASSYRLYRESGYIYRNKGTSLSISDYVESLTGWESVVSDSTNRFLTLDDGSFEYSTGNWSATGLTITNVYDYGPTYSYETSESQFSRKGVLQATLTAGSGTLVLPGDRSRTKSVPVTGSTTYYLRVPTKAVTGTPALAASIEWYTENMTLIQTSAVGSLTTSASWVTSSFTVTSPISAKFAVLKFAVTGSSSNRFLMDMLYFSEVNGPYRDPRSVTIICQPTRTNLAIDPSFEMSSTPWTAVTGTFVSSTDSPMIGVRSGKAVGSPFKFRTGSIPALSYYPYSVSAYAKSTGGTCSVNLEWYDSSNTLITTNTASFGTMTGSWQRVDYTVVSPDNAASVKLTFTGTGTVYVDAVTFERTDRPQIFFSGTVSDSDSIDGSWSGGSPNSYSVLYPGRSVKLARLRQTLEYYVPTGVSYRVLLWDSQDPEVQALVPNGE